MSKTEKTISLITQSDFNVPDTLKLLEEKLSSLQKIEETPYKTNGSINGFSDVRHETRIEVLIRMYSTIYMKEKAYNEAAESLGLTHYPIYSEGGTSEDWKHDIQLRIKLIQQKDTFEKLNKYKEEVSKFMSREEQKSQLMSEMQDFFKKL